MPILKGHKKILMTYLLVGYLILTSIFLGLFFYKSNLIHSLEEQTYEKINNCMIENDYAAYGEEQIKKIFSEYKNKQSEIEKDTLVNSITGVLITIGITIATINKIITDTKNIWMEFSHEFREKESGCSYEELCEIMEHITKKINHDQDLLKTEIEEMRAGMKQIGQVVVLREVKENDENREELGATMQQMNSAIEEMNILLMDMEKKIQYLSNNMKKYSIKNKS